MGHLYQNKKSYKKGQTQNLYIPKCKLNETTKLN